jgi:hypothetical protein
MSVENTHTPNGYQIISILPDVVREVHLVHEKTWKAIPSYKELHLPVLGYPRSLQH